MSIKKQNTMTPALLDVVNQAGDKTRLANLYLPYMQKHRTKAQIATEAARSAADALQPSPWSIHEVDAGYMCEIFTSMDWGANPGVPDAKVALDGARQILMERFAEDASLMQSLRNRRSSPAMRIGTKSSSVISTMPSPVHHSLVARAGADAWPPRWGAGRRPAPRFGA